MRPLPRRLPSRSAKWALRIALFVPVLAIFSILAHRSGRVDTPTFLVLLVVVAAIALLALFFVFLAIRSLWVSGKRGGRRASWALILSSIVLAPYVYGATLWVTRPNQSEVSTDGANPPIFRSELAQYGDAAAKVVAEKLEGGYPAINGRRFSASPDFVLEEVLKIAKTLRWTVADRRGRIGADTELVIEFAHKTLFLAMPVRIIVRLVDEGETSYLDVRSKSFFTQHDLGLNAQMINNLLAALDFNLIGQLER